MPLPKKPRSPPCAAEPGSFDCPFAIFGKSAGFDAIRQARDKWTELWNLVYTQDTGNQSARADIVVDGKVVLSKVPVTTLLFLDKQVNDLETFVSKLPTPDPSEEWAHDPNTGLLRSRATDSVRTSKEPTVIVKYDATKEHPAQTELFTKDVPVGTWTQIVYSGCLPTDRKNGILARIHKLQDASSASSCPEPSSRRRSGR